VFTMNVLAGELLLERLHENRYTREKKYHLDGNYGSTLRCDMESTHRVTAPGHSANSETELELLIAKYTLEYLYRWTNHFDPVQLAQIRQILDTGEESKGVLKMLTGNSSLPS